MKTKTPLKLSIGLTIATFVLLSVPEVGNAMLTRQLEITMSGADVGELQTFLAKDNTIYPEGLVTSYFGPLTKTAVTNFQARNGIATVGRVGPITLLAINNQMNGGFGTDRNAPTISSINVKTTSSSANIAWNTNENASALIYYSAVPLAITEANSVMGVNISGSTLLVHTNLQSMHVGNITGLQSNTTYYYVVYVRDGSGNVSVTNMSTFRTTN